MKIVDQIEACAGVSALRYRTIFTIGGLPRIEWIVVHRHGTLAGEIEIVDVHGLAVLHSTLPELQRITGRLPYDFFIADSGAIYQGLPLECYGAHSMDFNRESIGIALGGDFRHHAATSAQLTSLNALCGALVGATGARVLGHSELATRAEEWDTNRRATKSPDKLLGGSEECPGPRLHLDVVRRHAGPITGRGLLDEMGIVVRRVAA